MADILTERPKMLPWWVEILVAALLTLGSMVYVQTTHDDKQLGERVSAVEATQKAQPEMDKVRDAKVDHIQTQVDKLVEWALGHK